MFLAEEIIFKTESHGEDLGGGLKKKLPKKDFHF